MNPDLERLNPYPFARIATLLKDVTPGNIDNIALSIGEPKHSAPEFVRESLSQSWREVEKYPMTRGSDALRQSIADWLLNRFSLKEVSASEQVMAVNGTREALFAIAQCVLDRNSPKKVALSPNPFYQIYEGAILLGGLNPTFYDLSSENSARPGYWSRDDENWSAVQLVYLCNPGNPSGSVMPLSVLEELVELSNKHNFVIVSDECYSEVFRNEDSPPPSLLNAAENAGNSKFENCAVFHSLSKRSNLPGLRSGFVAGDPMLMKAFLLYRTYHGCSMAPPTQAVSIAAWRDETHVVANRKLYNAKYERVVPILKEVMDVNTPDAGFYLWPDLGIDDEKFTREVYQHQNISVVPGSYLARAASGCNPGKNHARLALVAPLEKCVEAAERIRYYFQHQQHTRS